MSNNKPRVISVTFTENSADQVRQNFYEAIHLLHDVIVDIDDTGPDTVVYGRRKITKTDVTAEIGNIIAVADKAYFYLHRFSNAENSSPII